VAETDGVFRKKMAAFGSLIFAVISHLDYAKDVAMLVWVNKTGEAVLTFFTSAPFSNYGKRPSKLTFR
jgi:hypothetical protein